jgi:hypothetical protein
MASLNLSEQALRMLLHQGFKLHDRWLVTLVDVDEDLRKSLDQLTAE